jgi:transcriptional regulator with XRE-family HTH domain
MIDTRTWGIVKPIVAIFAMDEIASPEFDYTGFAQRLSEAIFPEKITAFAHRIGVGQPVLSKYLKGSGMGPRLDIVAQVASGAGVSIDWLVWGKGDGKGPDDVLRIPRFDVTLAAGAGAWNEGRRRIEDMPFTGEFVRTQLGRSSTAGLSVLEARGDSMAPTILDRALIIVDEADTKLVDDVFAFVLAGDARIKRFRRTITGLSVISDNPNYPPEVLEGSVLDDLQVIGRALWVGQPL